MKGEKPINLAEKVSTLLKADREMSTDEQEKFLKSKGWEQVDHKGKSLGWLQPERWKRSDFTILYHTDDAVTIQKERDNIRIKEGKSL